MELFTYSLQYHSNYGSTVIIWIAFRVFSRFAFLSQRNIFLANDKSYVIIEP